MNPTKPTHLTFPRFIIVTDRGAFRAGWLQPAPTPLNPPANLKQPAGLNHAPSIRWVEELAFVHPRQHLVEQVSDMAGAYSAAESSGGQPRRMPSSASEVHWKIDADRHAIEDLAQACAAVLHSQKPESWSLSAPTDIHRALVEALPPVCRERLGRVIPKNLARSSVRDIIEHFLAD